MSIDLKAGQSARMLENADAQRLADLTGLRRDLRLVREACAVIQGRRGSPSTEHLRRACFDSAVLRYRRCFNGGVRGLFPNELLAKLTEKQKILHDHILELANRSIAHCVDGSEDSFTYFIYDQNQSSPSVSIHVYTRATSHHNKVNIKKVQELAAKLDRLLAQEGDRIAKGLLKSLKKLTGSEASALPLVKSSITDQGDALEVKYRKSKNGTGTGPTRLTPPAARTTHSAPQIPPASPHK
jgi:hypothetical protein